MVWTDVNKDLAKSHPLYGIKGWARFLLFSLVVVDPVLTIQWVYHWHYLNEQFPNIYPDHVVTNFTRRGVVELVLYWILGVLLWRKSRYFQIALTIVFLVYAILEIYSFVRMVQFNYRFNSSLLSFIEVFAWREWFLEALRYIPFLAIFLPYSWISTRINITCRHRLKSNDPFLERPSY